jgi:hypothetical protein
MAVTTGNLLIDFSGQANQNPYVNAQFTQTPAAGIMLNSGTLKLATFGTTNNFLYTAAGLTDSQRLYVEPVYKVNFGDALFGQFLLFYTDGANNYRVTFSGTGAFSLDRSRDGLGFSFGNGSTSAALAAGDILGAEIYVEGSTIVVDCYRNGVLQTKFTDSNPGNMLTKTSSYCGWRFSDNGSGSRTIFVKSLGVSVGPVGPAEDYALTNHGTPQANSIMEGNQFATTGPVYFDITGGDTNIANPDWPSINTAQLWLTDINDIAAFNPIAVGSVTYTIAYRVEESGDTGTFQRTVNVANAASDNWPFFVAVTTAPKTWEWGKRHPTTNARVRMFKEGGL